MLAASRLELRLRAASRPRARRLLRNRRRRQRRGAPGVRREHERAAHRVQRAGGLVRALRLRPALPALPALLQAVDVRPDPAPALGRAARARALPPGVRVRARRGRIVAGVEPHRVHRVPRTGPADDERPFDVRRGRAPIPPRGGSSPRAHVGRAARGRPRGDGRALPGAHARLLAPLGEGQSSHPRLPGGGHPLGPRAQAPPVRGHGRAARRDDDEPARVPRLRAQLGLPVLLAARRLLHA